MINYPKTKAEAVAYSPFMFIANSLTLLVILGFSLYSIWYRHFAKRFICHVCEDRSKKLTEKEYHRNGGKHKERAWPEKS